VPLQDKLFQELKGRIKETDLSVPTKIDDYYYFTRTFQGKQYPSHFRQRGLDSPEELLLDLNELAVGRKYLRVGAFEVSPDHNLLAYSTDNDGSETYTLRVKDLRTGELLPDTIAGSYYGVVWANDGKHLFYTVLDAAKRPYKAYRHTLGTDPKDDVLVHHETDERFNVRLAKTRSRQFIVLTLASQITSEVRFLDAETPASEFRLVEPRQQGVEYAIEHHGNDFYIVTNDQAVNFRLMKAPISNPSRANWTEVIPHRPEVKLDDVDAFADHLVIYERSAGLKQMRVRELPGNAEHYVRFPEPVYTFSPGPNEEFAAKKVRLTYTSLVTPRTVYDYDLQSRKFELKKQDEVLGGYDPTRYESERLFATAADGAKVPISIVYRKGAQRNGRNPMLLYGYGSYGASMDPSFSPNRLSLIDRGFIYAIAHIRGGGDLGRPWYESGKLLNKRNTFTDFIVCAEHLIRAGYTSPERLAIQGGSAGGLLMGAVTNLRPDLFAVVVAQVPFVDVVNTMLDPSIPLTVIEYEEWGNPNDKAYFDYMLSYSPYDNVAAKAYPHILITAGLNDPRVQYWEPAKWTAKLRAAKTDDRRLLLKTNMGAGHGGASGRYDNLREVAFIYAFILDTLGIES
jgi:oligopeptidase B